MSIEPDQEWEEEADYWLYGADPDEEPLSELGDRGCLFLGRCLMPGIHYTGECHTAEMLEGYYQECLGQEQVAAE